MSNRRKLRNPFSRRRDNTLREKKQDLRRALYEMGPADGSFDRPPVGFEGIGGMASEAPVVNEVAAKVDGLRVGTAYIHEDGLVSILFDDDAPAEAMSKIKETAQEMHYSIDTEARGAVPRQD